MQYRTIFKTVLATAVLLNVTVTHADSGLVVSNAWSPEAPPVAPVMAGYMTVKNTTASPIAITAGESSAFDTVEIHDMMMHDGMMHMVKQEKLVIPAHDSVTLKPGGLHVMFIKPKKTHHAGDTITASFELSNKQTLTVPFQVKKREMQQHDHMHHNH